MDRRNEMDNGRVAVLTVLIEDLESAELVNDLLHEYGQYIIGRMGIPYRKRSVSVICVVLDAPQPTVSAISGRIGRIPGVSAKTAFTKSGG